MDTNFLMTLLGYPPIGKFALNMMKKNVLKPFQAPLKTVIEKQEKSLKKKFRILENTEIGRKLGVKDGINLQELAITNYNFYEPFFSNPSPSTLMYPLENYEKIRTSGTSGREKWFMIPRSYITKTIIETAIPVVMLSTYDGEKITLEYGDTLYINTAPRPFVGGVMATVASGKRKKPPLLDIVPNLNIPFEDKVQYFINNCDTIDVAVTQASIIVSQIMPTLKKTGKLKGLFCPDTAIAEVYFDEISRVLGTIPKTAYSSTETLHCSISSAQHPLGFFLDWRRGLFEFIPLKNGTADEKEILGIDEVKVDEAYQIIFTSLETELTRYNTLNALKCIAKGDDLLGIDYPIFKFHARLEKTIALHNFTRISENELITVLRESKIPFVEFTTRTEVHEGLQYLTIYIETTEEREKQELRESIHKRLYYSDGDYKDLADFYGYVPIKVHLLPKGVFAKYLMGKVAAMAKVERVEMRDEEFRRLIQIAKGMDQLWQPT